MPKQQQPSTAANLRRNTIPFASRHPHVGLKGFCWTVCKSGPLCVGMWSCLAFFLMALTLIAGSSYLLGADRDFENFTKGQDGNKIRIVDLEKL